MIDGLIAVNAPSEVIEAARRNFGGNRSDDCEVWEENWERRYLDVLDDAFHWITLCNRDRQFVIAGIRLEVQAEVEHGNPILILILRIDQLDFGPADVEGFSSAAAMRH